MKDFVYICRSGDNEELRYSIRSVAKIFPNARIWVVGGKPSWYSGNYIEVVQSKSKYANAHNNLVAICKSKNISESFILMNDDFFILKNFELDEVFNGGLLLDKIDRYSSVPESKYTRKLIDTYQQLLAIGIDNVLDYELHVPMAMEKEKLSFVIKKYPNLLWRSVYGNLYSLGGNQIMDVKIYNNKAYSNRSAKLNDESIFVSTQDESFEFIYKEILKNMFDKPSSFEA
jgi:hypothetical protein